MLYVRKGQVITCRWSPHIHKHTMHACMRRMASSRLVLQGIGGFQATISLLRVGITGFSSGLECHDCDVSLRDCTFAGFPDFLQVRLLLGFWIAVHAIGVAFVYHRVPKFSPYGSVCCACAQRPGLPPQSFSRMLRSQQLN